MHISQYAKCCDEINDPLKKVLNQILCERSRKLVCLNDEFIGLGGENMKENEFSHNIEKKDRC